MTAAHYKGGHHPGNDLGLHYTALPPIVASCPYSDQLLVTRKFWSPGANRPSQVRGRFCPIRRPLFQGSRRGTDGRLLSSMIVSSKPTAPSRLRSAEGRRGILSRGGRKTRPWFIGRQRVHVIRIGTLSVRDRDHDCPPPRQALSGRGSCARR